MINELIGIIGLLVTILVLTIRATVEITKMKSQLFPNGGTSLNDKVTRLQIDVVKIRSTIDSISTELGKPKDRKSVV
jgi:hypothetical protein